MKNNIFPIHTPETAPPDSVALLEKTKRSFGMIPNLEGVMATAPSLLKSYSTMWGEFDNTTLSPVERQIVYQTANFENTCTYCVPWHTLLARKSGMAAEDIESLREGRPLASPKHETLRRFTRELILQRGNITVSDRQAFFDAGYTPRQALEVIMGIAIKTMSNFTNSIAATPLDASVQSLAWTKPFSAV